jgi:hypothetical protein
MTKGAPVRIAVVFQPGMKAKPVWFEMNRKQHKISRTTYYWKDRVGETPLVHFAVVTEDEALYELVFNTTDQSWLLYPHTTE